MPLPRLTPEQRQAALAKAAEARKARGELLASVKSGNTSVTEVFGRTDDTAKRVKVSQVLRAVPGYGPAKVAALMNSCGIDDKRRVGGLGEQQRKRLLGSLSK